MFGFPCVLPLFNTIWTGTPPLTSTTVHEQKSIVHELLGGVALIQHEANLLHVASRGLEEIKFPGTNTK